LAADLGSDVVLVRSVDRDRFSDDSDYWKMLALCPLATNNAYLTIRSVTNDTIQEFGIVKTQRGIAFPLKDRLGKLVGFQERLYKGKLRYITHGKPVLFPLDRFYTYRDGFFVVEGIFGVLNAYQNNIEALALLGVSKFSKAAEYLHGKRCKIFFDDDDAGYLGALELMLSTNYSASVILPGAETDEISGATWNDATSTMGCKSAIQILQCVKSPDKIAFGNKILAEYQSRTQKQWTHR
jgi:DNA primase